MLSHVLKLCPILVLQRFFTAILFILFSGNLLMFCYKGSPPNYPPHNESQEAGDSDQSGKHLWRGNLHFSKSPI